MKCKMKKPKIVTIGVYGFTESSFFASLVNARVDTFCDIRMRRGMRGAKYSFVNSQYLQNRLRELGIRYIHVKELAPSQEIRNKQQQADKRLGNGKQTRAILSQDFVQSYKTQCLDTFKANKFLDGLDENTECLALFCVEREPKACHRSLVAEQLENTMMLEVQHILP